MSYLRDIMRRLAARRRSAVSAPPSAQARPRMEGGRSGPLEGSDPMDTAQSPSLPLDRSSLLESDRPGQARPPRGQGCV